MIWIILIPIVVLVTLYVLGKPQHKPEEAVNQPSVDRTVAPSKSMCKVEVSMYFMHWSMAYDRMRKDAPLEETKLRRYYSYATDFTRHLGLASQGRTKELSYVYNTYLKSKDCEWDDWYKDLLIRIKDEVYSMARIAKKIDNSDMMDMKDYESIGGYMDRKLLLSKKFMAIYMFFVDFDFKEYYEAGVAAKEEAEQMNE